MAFVRVYPLRQKYIEATRAMDARLVTTIHASPRKHMSIVVTTAVGARFAKQWKATMPLDCAHFCRVESESFICG